MAKKSSVKKDTFTPSGNHITIRFDNQKAAEHFLAWLDGQGEQDYWNWMEYREKEEPKGDITARSFDYHNPGNGVVTARCGRMDRDWNKKPQ